MINFFRKTRKKMADDNKPMKYMKYAIGEIVLVVVGILIAVQINNWNELRKDRIKLRTNIREIKKSLENDLKLTDDALSTLDTYENSGIYLLNFLLEKSESVDSIQLKTSFLLAGFYIDFSLNSEAYEKLVKENNSEIIVNDSIVMALSNFYKTYDWEKFNLGNSQQQSLYEYRDYTTNFTDPFAIRDAFLYILKEYNGISLEAYKSNKFSFEAMVVNWNKMKSDKNFQIILDKILITRMGSRLQFYKMRAEISNLLKMLDTELEKSA